MPVVIIAKLSNGLFQLQFLDTEKGQKNMSAMIVDKARLQAWVIENLLNG